MLIRGTTPVIILKINTGIDLTTVDICHVTIVNEGGSNKIIYEDVLVDAENNLVRFEVPQEDSFKFKAGKIKLQLRVKLQNGSVLSSKIITTTIGDVLEEVVL